MQNMRFHGYEQDVKKQMHLSDGRKDKVGVCCLAVPNTRCFTHLCSPWDAAERTPVIEGHSVLSFYRKFLDAI